MPGNYIVHNEELIDGNFPVRILDPDQYGVYTGMPVTNINNDLPRTIIPIGKRISGLLPEPINNGITLDAGIYIIRLPRWSDTNSIDADTLDFYVSIADDVFIAGLRWDISSLKNTRTTGLPPFIIVLDKTETIHFEVRSYVTQINLSVHPTISSDIIITKLDQPRISSLDKGYRLRMKHPIVRTLVAEISSSNNFYTPIWYADEDCYVIAEMWSSLNVVSANDIVVNVDGQMINREFFPSHGNDVTNPMWAYTYALSKGQSISIYTGGSLEARQLRVYKVASEYASVNAGY